MSARPSLDYTLKASFRFSEDLVEFIGGVIEGASQPGLRQGGSLSPLLLYQDLYPCLDRLWCVPLGHLQS